MLADSDRKIASELHHRLNSTVSILDFRIFGSRARGDHSFESDLDVFIEVKIITPEIRRKIDEIVWEVGFEMDRIITVIVATSDQLERGPMGANPLIRKIESEGIPL